MYTKWRATTKNGLTQEQQTQKWNNTGTKVEQNRHKSGTKPAQKWNKTGTEVEQNRHHSGIRMSTASPNTEAKLDVLFKLQFNLDQRKCN